ncbi:3,4-dihydroxy-2-butanone 4-phosphate synthase (EC 4.1.99.12) / GTP cyclohydrolase II (EC 3.5.4.25) [uncultured Gammaproteobacteria bacterium]|jgi:3,4-dihydroxy 2-butanone 4-phosphate synthase/GTP cyclohydrolase II|uniref:3,4-dihydroxy-2-butanone 4-phosphate synthase n=3 Tax=sulfur-oxidizing symbionts TaxID=32036 RepID=A0A1H6MWK5_9GAMM|nr:MULTISPECIES: 3,4-dihydroxy-2-butanone-4-phosphate synthase [sulfur-oxidizing symbionts]CAC9494645.1 3,4-dihydroxy-2-butanone 4-phosphate synthase (EC 4.1.99.12) / GTP cyclohydrolase II (EC 3.5.4.25) [uncultured Gammaproteobacteria bacterium]CAB5497590.1 3,4-dihydroxy-2-butanone 4-phosphate synthase (EC / GTP cyclohydrolase II (EC [Bathymodiolus thermophilus thioautotrophic gill symbiont]CAB5503990.1 3,4-dihydroxy-2-butanone 4-phosphate synthase (EC / GTP cyclohydrolase II (EC [Bathymodiolus 
MKTKASIEAILEDYKQGKMIILMDDEDRENEGDLIIPAATCTKEDINFMATHGRGLICLTLTQERCKQLNLPLMVTQNNDANGTNFTVSIEASTGVTTGISAADRAKTVLDAVAPNAKSSDIVQPGHIFPLMAQPGGVLIRPGHTEAGCDLARLAGLEPASVIVEILNDDGSMARRDDLEVFAEKHSIKWGTIEDLISYRVENEKTIERINERPFSTKYGEWALVSFLDSIHQQTHTALVKGNIDKDTPVCVRVHMENVFTDVLQENTKSLHVDDALAYISKEHSGVFLLIRPHEASSDVKTYGVGAQILSDLGVGKMRILGSPRKLNALKGFGLEVVEYITGEK